MKKKVLRRLRSELLEEITKDVLPKAKKKKGGK